MTQHDLAAQFRRLHTGPQTPLVLANAWDAMSARLVEAAGAAAIATTSAGISWSLGYPDGHGVTRDAMIESIRHIVQSVRLPVSADVESGYGSGTPDDVAETATRVIEADAVGVARVSVGPHLARSVMAHIRKAASEVLSVGTYESLSPQLTSPEANGLFAPRP